MLDPKIIKEKPDRVREMIKARAIDFDLDGLLEFDLKRRDLIIKTDNLRNKKNQTAIKISEKKKTGENISSILDEMKDIASRLSELESEQQKIEESYSRLAFAIPNMIHESVPIGIDENTNLEIRRWGDIPKFNFPINDHITLSEDLDLIDLERAAKSSWIKILLFEK